MKKSAAAVTAALLFVAVPAAAKCDIQALDGILGKRLGVDLASLPEHFNEDVMDIVCRPHPLRQAHTIVAMFHKLSDQARNDYREGLAVAVVDIQRKSIVSLYRGEVNADATIRIARGSLSIDMARYYVTPGVRAFGVRMDIGYTARCASDQGESNYLRLFVEEGSHLRQVLDDLPMTRWYVKEGEFTCDGSKDQDYVMEYVKRSLQMLPSMTEGWFDIRVREVTYDPANGANAKPSDATAPDRILRARGKKYVFR
jgi:hypothetical protein